MAPKVPASINAAHERVVIYSPSGEAVVTTILNAQELIRFANFSTSAGGAAKPLEIVPSAAPVRPSVVNGPTEEPAQAPVQAPAETETAPALEVPEAAQTDAAAAEEAPEETPDEFDANTAPLADCAERLIGKRDVAAYLEGFSATSLREIASERFGEQIHHRTSKDKIIEKLIALETEKNGA